MKIIVSYSRIRYGVPGIKPEMAGTTPEDPGQIRAGLTVWLGFFGFRIVDLPRASPSSDPRGG